MYKELTDYIEFIDICTDKGLLIQYNFRQESDDSDKYYELFAMDGILRYECHLNSIDTSTGLLDFETNYKDTANRPLELRDSDGKPKINSKLVKGKLYAQFIYFTTGDSESLCTGEDICDCCSITTSTGTSTGITTVSFMPPWNYDIEGGGFNLLGAKDSEDMYLSFILAPNIPAEYGGNFKFMHNKKIIRDNEEFYVSAPPKTITYFPSNPYANECALIVTHGISTSIDIELFLKTYKE